MRRRYTITSLLTFACAGAFALFAASIAASVIEEKSRTDVNRVLGLNGIEWAQATTSGLQVFLRGEAPDEASRFHAIREAGRVVDAARVIDMMTIHVPEPITPPKFSVEILRNDDGVSLIGLVPAATGSASIVASVADIAGDEGLVELLDEASFSKPELWDEALEFGVRALADLPRSKISISGGTVNIVASSEGAAQKRELEENLTAMIPEGVVVTMEIAAPRPVITPFTMRFVKDERGARFDACTSDTQAGVDEIEKAAKAAGLTAPFRCSIGLGVPSPEWDRAVTLALGAVNELGLGTVTISDADVSLLGVPSLDPDKFFDVAGRLQASLPAVFSLETTLPEPEPEAGQEDGVGPAEFIATLSPEGLLQLRGPVPDERTKLAAINLARAKFGGVNVSDALRIRPEMELGWGLRIFAGIEALSELRNGLTRVTAESVQISGNTGNANSQAEIAALLAARLGGGSQFEIDVIYREALDPLASIPTAQECVDSVTKVLEGQKITFAPSSADINDEGRGAIEQIVEIMKDCEHVPMEVAGHTDSQGREIMNKELSQARADAVVNALLARRVLTSNLTAVGYGEEMPIADNETEEGREENRRIEFSLILPEEEIDAEPAQEPVAPSASGETSGADGEAVSGDTAGAEGSTEATQPDEAQTQEASTETSNE